VCNCEKVCICLTTVAFLVIFVCLFFVLFVVHYLVYPFSPPQHLLEMHNLCTLMSLLNGLAHPAITRLKKSFAKLDKATIRRLEALQTLARPGDNFKMLRDELKRASNPCIPYL